MSGNADVNRRDRSSNATTSRRRLLQAAGASVVLGSTQFTGSATAQFGCSQTGDGLNENEHTLESSDSPYRCNSRLESSSHLVHTVTNSSGGREQHLFILATTAKSELSDDGPTHPLISGHEVTLESEIRDSYVDFCQPRTGVSDSGGSELVDAVAESVIQTAATAITSAAYLYVAADIYSDTWDKVEEGNRLQHWQYLRNGFSQAPRPETTVQAFFEVDVPAGETGDLTVTSTTYAGDSECTYGGGMQTEEAFQVVVRDDYVTIRRDLGY